MEDREIVTDSSDHVTAATLPNLGGPCHVLCQLSSKSKRISQSTSHAENLAQVSGVLHSQMVAIRFTEIFTQILFNERATTKLLLRIQDEGSYLLPLDVWTDCMDLFSLTTGLKGVPADKSQRLSVLTMREERLAGRLRNYVHMPTAGMIADALTKQGTFAQFMKLLTTGFLRLPPVVLNRQKPVTLRRLASKCEYTEDDLLQING
jgi:hypothetical protein